MCDYSLEAFRTEKADTGVSYELKAAVTGSKGFFKNPEASYAEMCAACITEGSVLRIEIPEAMQYEHGITAIEDVLFAKLHQDRAYGYHDGVRLENGREYTLQDFPVGTRATVLMLADAQAPEDKPLASPAPTPVYEYGYIG